MPTNSRASSSASSPSARASGRCRWACHRPISTGWWTGCAASPRSRPSARSCCSGSRVRQDAARARRRARVGAAAAQDGAGAPLRQVHRRDREESRQGAADGRADGALRADDRRAGEGPLVQPTPTSARRSSRPIYASGSATRSSSTSPASTPPSRAETIGAPRGWARDRTVMASERESRTATAPPGRSERWGVWGAMSGPPMFTVFA